MKKNVTQCLIFVMILSWQLIANVAFAKANMLEVGAFNQLPTPILLSSYLGVLEDSTGILTLADVQKEDVAQRFQTDLSANRTLNMSYTSSAYWLRLELENSSDKPIERVLAIDHPLLANLDFYFQTDNEHYETVHTGYSQPLESQSRSYEGRIFAFPISLPAHSQHTLYLRVQTPNAMILPILLWQPNDFYIHERNNYAMQAIYFGLVITVILLSFVFVFILKESDYLLYVAMIFFTALTLFANKGLGREFLWHDLAWLTRIAPLSFASFAMVSQVVFLRRMLDTFKLAPKIDCVLKLLVGIALLIPVVLLLEFQFAKFIMIIFSMTVGFSMAVSFIGMRKGKRNAYFLFTAFAIFMLGIMVNTMLVLALVPTNFFTIYSTQISSAIEFLVFTFLLIDRYQLVLKEKQENDLALRVANNENELLKRALDENELLNRQVNHMQKLESIGRLTSGIAHDFNNILACMIGYNEMNQDVADDITDATLKSELEHNMRQIHLASKRATSLIEKMLTYCRQNTTEKIIIIQPTKEVISEVVEMLRPALTSRIKLEFVNQFDNDREYCKTCDSQKTCENINKIEIDAVDLHQIITNLAVNARDAMKERGGVITISLNAVMNITAQCVACAEMIKGDFIELRVSDNGTGIEPKIIHRLFDPFFTTKPQGEGTGLGLSTVIGMVHSSHGHVLIESDLTEKNHGTSFRLLFPQPSEML